MRRLALLTLAAAALGGCSAPNAKSCAVNADCPADTICVQQLCQRGAPSGGAASTVVGAGHLTSGTLTMDAVVGQPVAPTGAGGSVTLMPAENTR